MARIVSQPVNDEAEENESDNETNDSVEVGLPAVSDSRRRRMVKRGELPTPAASAIEVPAAPTRKDRPTPAGSGARTEVEKSKNPVVRAFNDLMQYFRDVYDELRKVTWLTTEENRRLTYIVLVVTTMASLFLGGIGLLFGYLTQALTDRSSTIIAGALAVVLIVGVAVAWLFRDRLFGSSLDA